jgi:hypothetical protein
LFASHPILSRFAPVDLRNPVAKGHPLNRGRVAWYLTLPGWYGGSKFYDLMGLNPGTLASMGNTSNGWRATTRPGGWGHVLFAGGSANVAAPNFFGTLLTGKVASAAAWMYPTGSLTAYQSVFDGTSSTQNNRQISVFLGGAANHLFVSFANGGTGGTEITLTDSWVLNTWQRLLVTSDGTTITVYRNGRSVGSAAAGIGTGFTAVNASGWQIGNNPSGGGAAYVGAIDDACVWSHALSTAEAKADYDLSRQGYPGVLNRLSLTAFAQQFFGGQLMLAGVGS